MRLRIPVYERDGVAFALKLYAKEPAALATNFRGDNVGRNAPVA